MSLTRRLFKTIFFLLIVISLDLNAVHAKDITENKIDISTEDTQSGTEKADKMDEYLIGAEDVIDVLVWKDEELSKRVAVRPDGKITLPLIDDIQAEGRTSLQLKKEIVTKLKKFVDDPNITVTVLDTNSSRVYVLGEVASPGVFPLKSKISILHAIAMAGGFREFAASNKMFILRKNGEKTERINVSYKDIIKGRDEQNVDLKRGDIIIVP